MERQANEKRLDISVMELRGFSRAYAREAIEAGLVLVKGKAEPRPGRKVSPYDITVLAPDMPYVSRGGVKLASALGHFSVNVSECVCLDAGASTGGFTDCMLKAGARHVYAADVGKGQLDAGLRADSRVTALDETDIRSLSLPEAVDFAACDLSFISLTKVIPYMRGLIKPGGGFICLIKPQFETERRGLSKKGVVRDSNAREAAVKAVLSSLTHNGFVIIGVMESPIKGGDGNIEYLSYVIMPEA